MSGFFPAVTNVHGRTVLDVHRSVSTRLEQRPKIEHYLRRSNRRCCKKRRQILQLLKIAISKRKNASLVIKHYILYEYFKIFKNIQDFRNQKYHISKMYGREYRITEEKNKRKNKQIRKNYYKTLFFKDHLIFTLLVCDIVILFKTLQILRWNNIYETTYLDMLCSWSYFLRFSIFSF